MQASLSNSGSIFKHSAAAPFAKSVSGRTRQSNHFGALPDTQPQLMAPVYLIISSEWSPQPCSGPSGLRRRSTSLMVWRPPTSL